MRQALQLACIFSITRTVVHGLALMAMPATTIRPRFLVLLGLFHPRLLSQCQAITEFHLMCCLRLALEQARTLFGGGMQPPWLLFAARVQHPPYLLARSSN